MDTTHTELSVAKIERYSGVSPSVIAKLIVKEHRPGGDQWPRIEAMLDAQAYYDVQNIAIKSKARGYRDPDTGAFIGNDTLSNARIASSLYSESVTQKSNYAFGRPFVLDVATEGDNDSEPVQERRDHYMGLWQKWLDGSAMNAIKRIGTDAINKGAGWAFVNINPLGELDIIDVEPESTYPAWNDAQHTLLDAVVRDYIIVQYENEQKNEIRKIEYWDSDTVEHFEDKDGSLTLVSFYPADGADSLQPHMSRPGTDEDGNVTALPEPWGRVPFLCWKGNADERPLLNYARGLIDAYDNLISKAIDTVADDMDPLLVLSGYTADKDELKTARLMMKNMNIMAAGEGGDAHYLQVKADITANLAMQEALRKAIREAIFHVNVTDIQFGSGNTNMAIKSAFQNLDTYINGVESEFNVFLDSLKYFFDRWLEYCGKGTAEEWARFEISAKFDRDMMIDESGIIDDVVKQQGLVSQETLDNNNPWVKDPAAEQARREAEAERQRDDLEDMRKLLQNDASTSDEMEGDDA